MAVTQGKALRHAATVMVLRPGAAGTEVLMVRRHGRSGFAADAWVFPGGVIDEPDRTLPQACWRGIDPAALAPRFRASAELVLGMHVAAVRETFEEAGLLLATTAAGEPIDLLEPDVVRMRRALAARDDPTDAAVFRDWLARRGFVLDLGALEYWSHWITPRMESKRFNTRFFLARAPQGQIADHDRVEITDQAWITPSDALEAAEDRRMLLIYPTIKNLEEMVRIGGSDPDALVAAAAAREDVPTVLPHFEELPEGGWRVLHPGDPGFPTDTYQEELA
ncbi:MAG: NUDIX hydrolase [Acidimicrobiia bacterium]